MNQKTIHCEFNCHTNLQPVCVSAYVIKVLYANKLIDQVTKELFKTSALSLSLSLLSRIMESE